MSFDTSYSALFVFSVVCSSFLTAYLCIERFCKKFRLELTSDGEQSHPATISNAVVSVNATLGNFNAKSLCESLFTPYARVVRIQLSALVPRFVKGINYLGGSGKASGAMRLLPSGFLP
jgi:hypothetical protein